ncbi:MAG: HlyC/CorC family transporter [Candidatus Omnitrophica bacterium]|nr:HlyC/CorC family transporter [Candidatus Omnitrophota bacterium]
MTLIVPFFGVLLLLGLSAFFSASETALFSLTRMEKRRLEERHPIASIWISKHLENPRRTLISIIIGNLVVNTLASAMVTLTALNLWGTQYLGLAVLGFTLALIFFGDIVPKVLAIRSKEGVVLFAAFPLQVAAILLFPFRKLTHWISDALLGFIVGDKKEHPVDAISQDELHALVKIGEEEGILDRQERHMLQKLFELGKHPVKDIMTPRIDVAGLDIDAPRDEQETLIQKYHHHYFPVYRDSLDHVLGVVSVQEYVLYPDQSLSDLIDQPLYVPSTKRIDDLLSEFREKKKSFAVCVDEYGGMAGIVTQEDVLEEIFGEFYDEYSKVENPIRPTGPQEYLVEAKIPLKEFNEYFSLHLESPDASTLGGFILEKLGEVPTVGKMIKAEKCEIKIQDMIRQRIKMVIVRLRP